MGEKRNWGATLMKRVLISVEGPTEETFIKNVLAHHLMAREIYLTPILVSNKRGKYRREFKGGLTSYDRAKRDILNLLSDSDAVAVTTMYDLYGLPDTFPGYSSRPATPYDKVEHLEDAIAQDISNHRFYPYFQLHEFETFLFVDPDTTAAELGLNDNQKNGLIQINEHFSNPEDINDDPHTAPSKRMQAIYKAYDKEFDGPYVTLNLGLDKLRQTCSHFNKWVIWLEKL